MKVRILFFAAILLLIQSCYSDKDDKLQNRDCKNTVCTDEFRIISVNIQSPGGDPIALDSIKVVLIENDTDITSRLIQNNFDTYSENGSYPVFSDIFTTDYQNEEVSLSFSGYINAEEAINENYKVGADCCHVYLVSGNTELVLE